MALPGSPREQVCPSVCHSNRPSRYFDDGIEGLQWTTLRRHAPLEKDSRCNPRRTVTVSRRDGRHNGAMSCSTVPVVPVADPHGIVIRRDQAVSRPTGPRIRPGYPLNLSILISGGKETNKDSLSNGERSGNSSNLKSPVLAPANCSL